MPFGLYLHYPFCRFRCSYCDYYKELYDPALEKRFYAAVAAETELAAAACRRSDRRISSIYVGGGTPSLTDVTLFSRWVACVKRHFDVAADTEFTVECNPESATLDKLERFREVGVNRLVLGVETFDRRLLKTIKRKHDRHHCHRAVYYANALGYPSFSVNLMYGLPGQTTGLLSDDVDQLLDLEPPHISFYPLTVEAGTELARQVAGGRLRLPDADLVAAMYRGGCERISELGYRRYEVSSFAKPGHECRYQVGYWTGDDYLGLGPSAHSFMNGQHSVNVADLAGYVAETDSGRLPRVMDKHGLDRRMREAIVRGLRTVGGVSRRRFAERFGVSLESRLDWEQYRRLVESGQLLPEKDSLRLSDEGIPAADDILRKLVGPSSETGATERQRSDERR